MDLFTEATKKSKETELKNELDESERTFEKIEQKVLKFSKDKELNPDVLTQVLDLQSEVGELAKDILEDTKYGNDKELVEGSVTKNEIGDVIFSLLLLAHSAEVDISEALEETLVKFEERFQETGGIGSNG